jgi:di/tripeptidase
VVCEISGQRPAGEIPSSHPLVRLAARCLEAQGVQPSLNVGSTDANIPLSRGLQAVCLGLTTGCGAHTLNEAINIPPLTHGLRQLVSVVEQSWQALS